MAKRPWLTTDELKEYSDFDKVKNRSEVKLQTDITRAENYIIHRTNNEFKDDKYPEIVPTDIKLAAILVAEFYANAASITLQSEYQSESFKDYSYTKTTSLDKTVDDVDIDALISRHVLSPAKGEVSMKLRRL